MATFTTDLNKAAWFPAFTLDDLDGKYLYESAATSWRTGPYFFDGGTDVQFEGVGFSFTGGALTGGTIHDITKHTNGATDFTITDMSLSGAAYHAFVVANDSTGFKNAVFGGADTITGSNVTDYLMGYGGNDTINGLDGDDIIDGGTGADKMVGGKGDDVYLVDNAGDTTKDGGGSTADMIIATINLDMNKAAYLGVEQVVLDGAANLYAYGNLFGNKIYGNEGSNTLKGNGGNDEIWGAAGNDKLDGGTGDDHMHGGAGSDTYTVDSLNDHVDETDGFGTDLGGIDTVNSSALTTFLTDFVENLVLTGSAAEGTGNDLNNKITGNDQINVLNGGGGEDTLIGGGGSDYFIIDDVDDKITETSTGGTADRAYSSLNYTLPNYVEELVLTGAAPTEGTGNGSANRIYGNTADNVIDGLSGNDELWGGAGDDTAVGGLGNDKMHGGVGDDILDVSQGNDTVCYDSALDGYDLINGFDGNAGGGQDVLSLDGYFDSLGVGAADRAARATTIDYGATVDVWVDSDGNGAYETKIATIGTNDAITVGQDILVGT